MAGYSQTPLVRKLGMKDGDKLLLIHTPENYPILIDPWPDPVEIMDYQDACDVDFIHYFTQQKAKLVSEFSSLKQKLRKGGMLWVSWPKGKSRLPKDLNENDVRRIGLENGLVDVKVCAVDEDWSGLKFMYRRKDR